VRACSQVNDGELVQCVNPIVNREGWMTCKNREGREECKTGLGCDDGEPRENVEGT
jgi:hypothetical protein